MNNIFSFIKKSNNIDNVSKNFFKQPIFSIPDEFLREFLLDNWGEINIYLANYYQKNSQYNCDNVYDYFFLLECKRMKVYVHDIKKEENKKKFENICNYVEDYLKKFSIPKIQKIILDNFEYFLKCESNWLKKLIFWFFWNSKKFNIFFEKIKNITFYQTFIIDNFKKIKKNFMDHLNWCKYFFNYERLKKYLNNGEIINNWFLNFLLEFKNLKNQTIENNYKLFENFLFNQLNNYHLKLKNIDDNSWIENKMILENILNFLIKNKTPYKKECEKIVNDIKSYEREYLEKYGKKFSFSLLVNKSIFDAYNNIEDKWYPKLFGLTHQKIENNKFVSHFEKIGSTQKNIIDKICDSEEYFFDSKISYLNINNRVIIEILKKNYLPNLNTFSKQINKLLEISLVEIRKSNFNQFLNKDIDEIMLFMNWFWQQCYEMDIETNKNDNKNLKNNFFMMTLLLLIIEKIMKLFYLCEYPKNKSLSCWNLTLGVLLTNFTPLEIIFGKNAIKIINYILNDSKGLKIRNKLMHFDFISTINETINTNNMILLLYVLLVILNSWILYKGEK